jgi:hypothetical protein
VHVRVVDVLLLRDRALPLATSLLLGVDIESCLLEQTKKKFPDWNYDNNACRECKTRQQVQQVMRARRAQRL